MNRIRVMVTMVVASVLAVAGCSGSDDSGVPPPSGPGTTLTSSFKQGVGFNGAVSTIVAAADGSQDIYVGGAFTNYNGATANGLIRLHQDGTVAQTFGQGFESVIGGEDVIGGYVSGVALADDGCVYVWGGFSQFDGQPAPPLLRLTRTGIRDSSFQPSPLLDFRPEFLAVAQDGSGDIYVGGNNFVPIPNSPFDTFIGRIVRLNPDGSPDSTFPIATEFPGRSDVAPVITGLAALPGSGKVYVGGDMSIYNGQPVSTPLRLNPDGTVDSTFMTGSGVPPLADANAIEVIALDADSRDLYVGGRIGSYNGMGKPLGPDEFLAAIRIKETGALDTTFAPTVPKWTFEIAPAVDGTGDVFVFAVDTQPTQDRPLRFLRLNHSGGIVPTFHEPNLDGEVLTIAPVRDGTKDLYIGGNFTMYNGVPVNHIARIHADGSLASIVTTAP